MTTWAILAALYAIGAGGTSVVLAHDGVPLEHQGMCCIDECVSVQDYAERLDAYTYRLMRSGREVPASRTFHSTNGATIICKYPRGGVRCLFIPKPTVG